MLTVRPGDRVQVRDGAEAGRVTRIYGTGADAEIRVRLDGGGTVSYLPYELDLLVEEGRAGFEPVVSDLRRLRIRPIATATQCPVR